MDRTRTCIACGAKGDKRSLRRIVRAADGRVSFDATGRAAGRGAYVCSMPCFEAALSKGRLDRALKTHVGEKDVETLGRELAAACARGHA